MTMIQIISDADPTLAQPNDVAKKKRGQKHFKIAEPDMPSDELRGRLIESLAEANELIPAWNRLMQVAVAPNPFFDPSFLLPAMQHLGNGKVSLLVIEAPRRNTSNTGIVICGLVPVVQRRIYGIPLRTLEVWKHDQCFDCTPLIRTDCKKQAWEFMLEFVNDELNTSLFSLNTVLGEGDFANLVTEKNFNSNLATFCRDAFTRACFKPTSDEETYFKTSVAKSTRKGTERLRRKLEKLGEVTTDYFYNYDPELIRKFLELEASGWKGAGGTALASQPDTKSFFEDMMSKSMKDGKGVIAQISLNQQAIAMLVVLQQDSRTAQFKIAFDEQLKEFTPGTMVEFDEIRRMFTDEIEFSDSCADPNHSMINRLWHDRVRFQSLVIAKNKMLPRLAVSMMPIIQQFKFLFSK